MGALAGAAARLGAGAGFLHLAPFGQRSLVHRLQPEALAFALVERVESGLDVGVHGDGGGAQDVGGHEGVRGELRVVLEPGVVPQTTHLNAFVWVHGQQLLNELFGLLGHVPPGLSVEAEVSLFDLLHDLLSAGVSQTLFLTLERHLPRQHGVQDDAQAPQVT